MFLHGLLINHLCVCMSAGRSAYSIWTTTITWRRRSSPWTKEFGLTSLWAVGSIASVSWSCTRFACFSSRCCRGILSWWRLRTKQSRLFYFIVRCAASFFVNDWLWIGFVYGFYSICFNFLAFTITVVLKLVRSPEYCLIILCLHFFLWFLVPTGL